MALRYELTGNGPNKVLVTHNWMGTIRCYDEVRPYLDDSNFSYAFVDLRGYGLNKSLEGDYTASESARDLIDVANDLGWTQFHMVGHSMSGMIALRVCVEARSRVKTLVAITPVTAEGFPLDNAGRELFAAAASGGTEWLTIAGMLTSGRLPDRWYNAQLQHFRENVNPAAALGYMQMFSTTNFAAETAGLQLPALAVLGGHDFMAFCEDEMRQKLGKWLPSLEIEVIESSGHHPMLETPPYFAKVLEKFLQTNSQSDTI